MVQKLSQPGKASRPSLAYLPTKLRPELLAAATVLAHPAGLRPSQLVRLLLRMYVSQDRLGQQIRDAAHEMDYYARDSWATPPVPPKPLEIRKATKARKAR